nr:GntR family transcriptional regulator [Gordonia soli]
MSAEPVDLARLLTIDHESTTAPFEQLRAGVIAAIADGDLIVGERLPTVRRLAVSLGLAANTVAKSYRELESAGVIETRGRLGSYVRAAQGTALEQAQAATVRHVAALRTLGVDDATIVSLVTHATRAT